MNYYNEFDPYAAQWLRNLIAAGLIPAGDVDTRSITDVQPDDLAGYRQCHFFAGIGGWSLAARLAGWPDDRELWTGSAPCQPFSVAGKRKAQADDRHLWPHLFRLARARRPAVLMGEQVAAAVGKDWIDGVFADLEGIGYACGASVVPACAVDAPHRRDRLWFVAHTDSFACRQGGEVDDGCDPRSSTEPRTGSGGGDGGCAVGDPHIVGTCEERKQRGGQFGGAGVDQGACTGGAMANASSRRLGDPHCREVQQPRRTETLSRSETGELANTDGDRRSQGHASATAAGHRRSAESGGGAGHWDGAEWLIGHDGKARRFEPSIRLLAHGVPARVGRLRAYGNAIVPQVAAEVIGAYMDCYPDPAPTN